MRGCLDWAIRLACVAVVIVLVPPSGSESSLETLLGIAVAIIVAQFIIGGVGTMFDSLLARQEQQATDDAVRRLVDKILGGQPVTQEYALYLRSFLNDGSIDIFTGIGGASPGLMDPGKYSLHRTENLERRIRRIITAMGVEPVMIGRREFIEGPGCYVPSNPDDWWHVFTTLAKQAKVFVCLPSYTKGVIDELAFLHASGLLSKCILIDTSEGDLDRQLLRSRLEEAGVPWSALRPILLKDLMRDHPKAISLDQIDDSKLENLIIQAGTQ